MTVGRTVMVCKCHPPRNERNTVRFASHQPVLSCNPDPTKLSSGECRGRAEVGMCTISTHTPDVVSRKKRSIAHPATSEQGKGRRQWGPASSHAHLSFTTLSLQLMKSLVLSSCCNEQCPALEEPHGCHPGGL